MASRKTLWKLTAGATLSLAAQTALPSHPSHLVEGIQAYENGQFKQAYTVFASHADTTNPKALWHIQIMGELPDSLIMQQNYSFRTKDWRYIIYRNGKEELYDHRSDPGEWHNLAMDEEYDEKKNELKAEVMEIINKKN